MKSFKTAVFGALCLMMLSGCGANENYDNTAPTHTPAATQKNDKNNNNDNTLRDDAGNIIDDAGDAVKDTGDAANKVIDDVGNSVKD